MFESLLTSIEDYTRNQTLQALITTETNTSTPRISYKHTTYVTN